MDEAVEGTLKVAQKGRNLDRQGRHEGADGGWEGAGDGSERLAGQANMSTCHTGLDARPPLQKKGRKILSIGSSKN